MQGPQTDASAQLDGKYANYFEVGHNTVEFLIDFGQLYDSDEQASIHTRIVTSPVFARMLLDMLSGAVRQYESQHGEIHPI